MRLAIIGVVMIFLAMPTGLLTSSLASEAASPVACLAMLLGGLAVHLCGVRRSTH